MAKHSRNLNALITFLQAKARSGTLEQDQRETHLRELKNLEHALRVGDRRGTESAIDQLAQSMLRPRTDNARQR